MTKKNRLGKSLIYKGFRKNLEQEFGNAVAERIWMEANEQLTLLEKRYPDITGDSRMMVLPAAALYLALQNHAPDKALVLLKAHGRDVGELISRVVHSITCVPGILELLWRAMPWLMRQMSSETAGYTRRIVSESHEFVGVDILSCPLHDAAVRIGVPQASMVVCAMDKAYMTGFRRIRYTRTRSVAEGDECCDYRLSYDKDKK